VCRGITRRGRFYGVGSVAVIPNPAFRVRNLLFCTDTSTADPS
jgi:hypothetical protein